MTDKQSTFDRFAPVLLFMTIVLAFGVGVLWQKVSNLEGGNVTTKSGAVPTTTAQQPSAPLAGKLSKEQADKIEKVTDKDHINGNKNAKLFLITYSDFQCPFCKQFHPTTQQVLKDYGDKVAVVFRHFPLDSIHPLARPAANASECVASISGNDAFWKFADAVFADPTKLSDLTSTATGIGVNKASFESCLNAKKFESIVESQYQGGIKAGVTGTPGNFIVNSKGDVWAVLGAQPLTSVKATIDEALKS